MTPTRSVFALLLVAVLGARALILEDDPLVEKVKAIIANVNSYVSSHGFDELNIPDVGSRHPVQLKNGGFGVFSSIYVQDATGINETKQDDGSTLYTFNIKVGLSELVVHYDFDFSAIIIKEKGNFSLSVQKNSAEVSGSAVVKNDSTCEAQLTKVALLVLGDYKLTISPDNIPGLHIISQAILDLISPLLLPSLNKSLRAALSSPGVQNVFSSIACPELA